MFLFLFVGEGGRVHLEAKSQMAAKNNKYTPYTPGTLWSPIRMMPARFPNALWYNIMFAWLSHIKPVQMMILYRSEKQSLHNSRRRSTAILDLWISQMWHRDLIVRTKNWNIALDKDLLAFLRKSTSFVVSIWKFCAECVPAVCQAVNDTVFPQIVKFKIAVIGHIQFIILSFSYTISLFGDPDISKYNWDALLWWSETWRVMELGM